MSPTCTLPVNKTKPSAARDSMSYRGIPAGQDTRYASAEKKLLVSTHFPPEFSVKVNLEKVNLDVIKPWIAERVVQLLGFEDELVIDYAFDMLDSDRYPDPKRFQLNMTGFLERHAAVFCRQLWIHLISAQESPEGIPKQFVDDKKHQMRMKKADDQKRKEELEESRRREEAAMRGRGRGRGRGAGRGQGRGAGRGDDWRDRPENPNNIRVKNENGFMKRERSPPRQDYDDARRSRYDRDREIKRESPERSSYQRRSYRSRSRSLHSEERVRRGYVDTYRPRPRSHDRRVRERSREYDSYRPDRDRGLARRNYDDDRRPRPDVHRVRYRDDRDHIKIAAQRGRLSRSPSAERSRSPYRRRREVSEYSSRSRSSSRSRYSRISRRSPLSRSPSHDSADAPDANPSEKSPNEASDGHDWRKEGKWPHVGATEGELREQLLREKLYKSKA